jgi:hypothetical protein
MKSANECIDFIINTTKDIPHSNTTLANHLLGVYSLMLQAKAPEHLCLAGLFHSIYGTEFFENGIIIDRNTVRDYIGKVAEELVFLYCHFNDRDNTILISENKDLVFLGLMNLLEIYAANKDDKDVIDMLSRFQDKFKTF